MSALLAAHSGLRYVVLIFLILAIGNSFSKWMGKKAFTPGDKKIALFALIFTHIQILLGLVLYFISDFVSFSNMKETMASKVLRFFTVEHILLMLIAAVLITIGNAKSKKGKTDAAKHKSIAIFFLIGLILILVSIPWPFIEAGQGRGWF